MTVCGRNPLAYGREERAGGKLVKRAGEAGILCQLVEETGKERPRVGRIGQRKEVSGICNLFQGDINGEVAWRRSTSLGDLICFERDKLKSR
jgi:hypothetical protein